MSRIILLFLCCCYSWMAYPAQEIFVFENKVEEQRFYTLNQQLRCLVCQNQTIADSNAPLARDLRKEVAALIKQHYSDQEIIDYLTHRYGQFILYKPALTHTTWILWFGPFILLVTAFVALIGIIQRRNKQSQKFKE